MPAAGARQGLSNGVETTEAGLAIADWEDPERSPGVRPLERDSTSTLRPSPLSIDPSFAPYSGAGGGLLLSPRSDGGRTPGSAVGLLSHQIPPVNL